MIEVAADDVVTACSHWLCFEDCIHSWFVLAPVTTNRAATTVQWSERADRGMNADAQSIVSKLAARKGLVTLKDLRTFNLLSLVNNTSVYSTHLFVTALLAGAYQIRI